MNPEETMQAIFGDSLEKKITDDLLDEIRDMANPRIPTALDLRTAVPDHEKSRIEREFGK